MPKKAIERKNGVALWRQIADRIRMAITSGDYRDTGMLPPETALAETFGVNRHTVRVAIAFLADEGLLRAEQGKGTLIQRRKRLTLPISRRTRFSQGLGDQAQEFEVLAVSKGTGPANAEIAQALGIAEGSTCVLLRTLSLADGMPVSLSDHHFPAERFSDMAEAFEATGSITRAFARLGLADYVRISTEISARHADADESVLLKLSPGSIVLEAVAVNADLDAKPVQHSRTRFSADRVSLKMET
jgi:GntR family transcriptional regulator, phosphonate transport system regulatory protein